MEEKVPEVTRFDEELNRPPHRSEAKINKWMETEQRNGTEIESVVVHGGGKRFCRIIFCCLFVGT